MRKKEAKEQLRIIECDGVLNIQSLVIKLLSHSPSSSKCEKHNAYNEKMQLAQTLIHDIYRNGTYAIDFLRRR